MIRPFRFVSSAFQDELFGRGRVLYAAHSSASACFVVRRWSDDLRKAVEASFGYRVSGWVGSLAGNVVRRSSSVGSTRELFSG